MGDGLNHYNQPPLGDDGTGNNDDPMRWLQSLSAQGGTGDFTNDPSPNIDPSQQGYYDPNQYQQQQGYYDPNQQGYYDPNQQQQGYYDPNQYQQQQGYYDPNQQQGYYDPNQYQQQQGYYDPNQQQQGYYDPNQYQQQQGYYDPNQQQGYYDPNQQQQGYYDPNQQQQGYYDPNQQQQQQNYQEQPPADAQPEIDPSTGLPFGIDPMLWLESLAKNQEGVDTRFFLTNADMEIAPMDPNSVDPSQLGSYTPGESAKASAAPAPAPEPPPAEAPASSELEIDPSTGLPVGIDPMLWLESLAKNQEGVDTRFFMTDANMDTSIVDTARVTQAYAAMDLGNPATLDEVPSDTVPLEPPAAQPEAPAASGELEIDPSTGLPVGIDPMLWLESLAKNQEGVDTRFFMTDANMDTSIVDTTRVTQAYAAMDLNTPPAAEAEAEVDTAIAESYSDLPSQFDPPSFLDDLGSQLAGAEEQSEADLSWLDDLGKAEAEPLFADTGRAPAVEESSDFGTTSQTFTTPPPIAEDYTPQASTPPTPPASPGVPEEIQVYLDMLGGITLDEARQLAATGQLNGEQQLAWQLLEAKLRYDEKQANEPVILDEDLPPAEMGELPPWLQGVQVVSDDSLPFDLGDDSSAIFADATPQNQDSSGWLPPDLPASNQGISEIELPNFTVESIGESTSDLETPSEASAAAMGASSVHLDNYENYTQEDEWAKALDEEHNREQLGIEEDPTWFRDAIQRVESELGTSPSKQAPIQETPSAAESGNWLSAPADSDQPAWLSNEPESSPAAWLESPKEDLLGDDIDTIEALPSWLKPTDTASDDLDIKTWMINEASSGGTGMLREQASAVSGVFAELPPASQERLTPAAQGQLPAWAVETVDMEDDLALPTPAPAAPVIQAPPPPAPTPVVQRPPVAAPPPVTRVAAAPPPAPIVQQAQPIARQRIVMAGEPVPAPSSPAIVPATYEPFRVRLEANPEDHQTRLDLARTMLQNNDLESGLTQYQTLVENMGELDNVTNDLLDLVTSRPPHPTLRRVLGDAYMRQGYLQEALDAYRGALDSL